MPPVVSPEIEPVFDPARPGNSIDSVNALIPLRASWLRGVDFGETQSRGRGSGSEVIAIRPYEEGDDSRDIDWYATITDPEDEIQVREYRKEVDPAVWVLTDVLQHRFRANDAHFSKQNLGLAAVLASVQVANRKHLPTSVFATNGDQVWSSGRPRNGRHYVQTMARTFADMATSPQSPEASKVHLSRGLEEVGRRAVRNLVIVVSDFRDVVRPNDIHQGWQQGIELLRAKGNEILAIEVDTPWDLELPPTANVFRLGGKALSIGGKQEQAIRERYQEKSAQQQRDIAAALHRNGVYHLELSTDTPRWFTDFRQKLQTFSSQRRS